LLLPPGQYTVTVRAPGFATAEVKNVAITVGQQAEIPIALSVAGTQEVVNVSSAAELVETQRTSSTDTIDQRRIDNLPINGGITLISPSPIRGWRVIPLPASGPHPPPG